jgi:hypothetical protein
MDFVVFLSETSRLLTFQEKVPGYTDIWTFKIGNNALGVDDPTALRGLIAVKFAICPVSEDTKRFHNSYT